MGWYKSTCIYRGEIERFCTSFVAFSYFEKDQNEENRLSEKKISLDLVQTQSNPPIFNLKSYILMIWQKTKNIKNFFQARK